MIVLNLLGVVLCIIGAFGSPLRGTYDDNWLSVYNKTEDDSWRQLLQTKDLWAWTRTTTVSPFIDNFKDYNFNITDYTYKPQDPIIFPKYSSDYGSSYGSSSTTYSSWRTRSDFSGAIIIVLVVKFILIMSCYGCRHRRPTSETRVTRIPNNAQPSSLTVVRRSHIFLVVPRHDAENSPETRGDDSHDPASLLEQKTLMNDDLPPSYEEVTLSNNSGANTVPSEASVDNSTPSIPAPPQYI